MPATTPRISALEGVLADAPGHLIEQAPGLDPRERWSQSVAMLLADVYASEDPDEFAAARDLLADTAANADDPLVGAQCEILASVTRWIHQRHAGATAGHRLEPGSVAARFLRRIADNPGVDNKTLVEHLAVDETQVSRAGRQLFMWGLVTKTRHGRNNSWKVTASGRDAVAAMKDQQNPPEPIDALPPELPADAIADIVAVVEGLAASRERPTPAFDDLHVYATPDGLFAGEDTRRLHHYTFSLCGLQLSAHPVAHSGRAGPARAGGSIVSYVRDINGVLRIGEEHDTFC